MARIDSAQLPFLSRLFGAPPGAQIDVRVRQAEYEEFERVDWDGNSPTDLVSSRPLGLLRGVEAHALVVSPYRYDERRNALRVYTRLRIEIRFTGSRQANVRCPRPPPQLLIALSKRRTGSYSCAKDRVPRERQHAGMTLNALG